MRMLTDSEIESIRSRVQKSDGQNCYIRMQPFEVVILLEAHRELASNLAKDRYDQELKKTQKKISDSLKFL